MIRQSIEAPRSLGLPQERVRTRFHLQKEFSGRSRLNIEAARSRSLEARELKKPSAALPEHHRNPLQIKSIAFGSEVLLAFILCEIFAILAVLFLEKQRLKLSFIALFFALAALGVYLHWAAWITLLSVSAAIVIMLFDMVSHWLGRRDD